MQQEYAHAICHFLEHSFEDILSLEKENLVLNPSSLPCSAILDAL